MSLEQRAEVINAMPAAFVADLTIYAQGGRAGPFVPGLGCPCASALGAVDEAASRYWDAWPQLGDQSMALGETRRVGFVTLTDEGAEALKAAGRFVLWEGRPIGEATIVSD